MEFPRSLNPPCRSKLSILYWKCLINASCYSSVLTAKLIIIYLTLNGIIEIENFSLFPQFFFFNMKYYLTPAEKHQSSMKLLQFIFVLGFWPILNSPSSLFDSDSCLVTESDKFLPPLTINQVRMAGQFFWPSLGPGQVGDIESVTRRCHFFNWTTYWTHF